MRLAPSDAVGSLRCTASVSADLGPALASAW